MLGTLNPFQPCSRHFLSALLTSSLVGLSACTSRSSEQALTFVDRTSDTGVDFVHVCGGAEKDYILEVNGGGVALFDHDADGDLDVFLVNGSRFDQPADGAPSDALYRNDGNWTFTNVTEAAGLRESAWGCGVAVADVENDGDLDLFVTNYGPDELWLNDGDGTFTAAGARAGVDHSGWGASATFLDYDRDGFVDLFIVNYLEFRRELATPRGPNSCDYKGQKILCGPVGLPPEYAVLLRNQGDGTFRDVSQEAGMRAVEPGYGLGVTVGDFDADNWPDVYVAADTTPNWLFHNRGDGTFEEVGMQAGVALNDAAIAQAGMGVEFAFLSDTEREDLFVVNYEDDSNTLYRNEGNGFFSEVTTVAGLGAPCFKHLGWGTFFQDFDFDGDLDLFVAQGHVVPQADAIPSSPGYKQRNKLFLGDGKGHFDDASDSCGPGLEVKKSSRGAAAGDLDGDGDLDIVVNDIDDPPTFLECTGAPRAHWLAVRLEGRTSNRAAIGAVVRLYASGLKAARRIRAAGSYASHSELAARFGLGSRTAAERLEVTWPSGETEVFECPGVDRVLVLVEGSGTATSRE